LGYESCVSILHAYVITCDSGCGVSCSEDRHVYSIVSDTRVRCSSTSIATAAELLSLLGAATRTLPEPESE
jgi:hypothetical protein